MNKMVLQQSRKQARGAHRTLRAVFLGGLLISGCPALLVSQVMAGESSITLTLKTRYTQTTCLLTRNGADATGVQVVTMPVIDTGMVNSMGSGEWTGEVVPLNLGMRCPQLPETGVGIGLTVTPEISDTSAGDNVIASKKTTGDAPGPDLLLVDTGNPATKVTFSPGLDLPGRSCSGDKAAGTADCLQLTGNPQDYRIPLGIRVFVPAEGGGNSKFSRSEMLKPGTWSSTVTLNIIYQ